MSIDRELFKVIRILMSLRNLPPDFYSPFDDLNSVSFLSTSALKKASTNDQKNQQTPNPKRNSIKGANPAKGATTVISNKPISISLISGLFILSFSFNFL
jgi:hypothetical protein